MESRSNFGYLLNITMPNSNEQVDLSIENNLFLKGHMEPLSIFIFLGKLLLMRVLLLLTVFVDYLFPTYCKAKMLFVNDLS